VLQSMAREALTDLPASIGMIIVDDEFGTVLELPFGDDRQSAYLPEYAAGSPVGVQVPEQTSAKANAPHLPNGKMPASTNLD